MGSTPEPAQRIEREVDVLEEGEQAEIGCDI